MKNNMGKIVERFFDGVCDVIEFFEYKDDFGILQSGQKVVLKDIPCRVCYKNIKSAVKGKASDYVTQRVILMVGKDVVINNGSIIKLYQNGQTVFYQKTGEAAVYSSHKEIEMILENTFS